MDSTSAIAKSAIQDLIYEIRTLQSAFHFCDTIEELDKRFARTVAPSRRATQLLSQVSGMEKCKLLVGLKEAIYEADLSYAYTLGRLCTDPPCHARESRLLREAVASLTQFCIESDTLIGRPSMRACQWLGGLHELFQNRPLAKTAYGLAITSLQNFDEEDRADLEEDYDVLLDKLNNRYMKVGGDLATVHRHRVIDVLR